MSSQDSDAFESTLHGAYRYVAAPPPANMRLGIDGFTDAWCIYPARFHFTGYCAPATRRVCRLGPKRP